MATDKFDEYSGGIYKEEYNYVNVRFNLICYK